MAVTQISNAAIEEIVRERNNTLVTAVYQESRNGREEEQRIRMVAGNGTIVVDMNGNRVPISDLSEGMIVNAILSNAFTRSIPPQTEAFLIEIVKGGIKEYTTTGRIVDVDRMNRNFTTISDGNFTSIIRFNVPQNTPVTNRLGKSMNFNGLVPGMRVEVRHPGVMTASIPPQTTALEIKVL